MKRILNFGSLNIDTVYSLPHIVRPGETISATNIESFCGGKGFNQTIALARAGANVHHSGKIGKDGDELKRQLIANQVDCQFLFESTQKSGNALIQRSDSGQNCIILYGGANKKITTQDVDSVLASFSNDDILVCQNEISQVPYLIEKAHEKGMKIAFNPSPIDESVHDLPFNAISWLILNEIEGQELTGHEEPDEMLGNLLVRFPDIKIVLTLGTDGVIYADKRCRHSHATYDVPVIDTTGAGDTFFGYFVALATSEDAGMEIPEALKIASAAAAMAVTVSGALPSIPKLEEVKLFLAKSPSEKVTERM